MSRALRIVLAIVVLLAVAGGSFYGGTVYGKSQAQASFASARQRGNFVIAGNGTPGAVQGQFPGGGLGGQRGQGGQGGMVFGAIQQIGDGVMTIKDNDGKETQVRVMDTTLIEKNASVKLSDLAAGETVIVSGNQGSDGTITARSVQVAPAGRFMGVGRPPEGTPAP